MTHHAYEFYTTRPQEEHFDLIFSLNDTTGAGHIKVAELAQFMESLGHGLPAHQLEEMIKDMGMDEEIGRITLTLTITLTRPAVSHDMLQGVMEALSGVGVLKPEQLLPPASLVAGLTADIDPDLISAEDN